MLLDYDVIGLILMFILEELRFLFFFNMDVFKFNMKEMEISYKLKLINEYD